MKFTASKIGIINANLSEKKRVNPLKGKATGIGISLEAFPSGATVCQDGMAMLTVEDLSRAIVELSMLKDAIEEETGIIL